MESETDLERSGLVQADKNESYEQDETDGQTSSESPTGPTVPVGPNRLVYFAFVYAGLTFLFPYNTFITAVDYFQYIFPKQNPESIMTAVYLNITLATVAVNVMVVDRWSTRARVSLSFVLFVASLLVTLLLAVFLKSCDSSGAFAMSMAAVSITAIACGVQQPSIYGLSTQLPPLYPQAVMTGESVSGTIVSLNRIITKAAGSKALRSSTIAYFAIAIVVMLGGVGVQVFIHRSEFVNSHRHRGAKKVKAPLCHGKVRRLPSRSSWLGEVEDRSLEGDQLSSNNIQLRRYSLLGEASDSQDSATDEDGPSTTANFKQGSSLSQQGLSDMEKLWSRLKYACSVRWLVARFIWKWLLTVSLCYFVTLLLFPSLLAKVPQQRSIGNWTPVILIAIFNFLDLVGKLVGLRLMFLSVEALLRLSVARFILIPLLLLCIVPCDSPYLDTDYSATAVVISAMLGITNGVIGTVAMSCAASHVAKRHQEMAGNLMVFACLLGLTIGAYVAVGIDKGICQGECVSDALALLANSTAKTCPLTCLNNSTDLLR